MKKNLLSIGEAAKLMGVCENTLRDWDIEGKFKASRTTGNHRRYSLEQIREYTEENQKERKLDILLADDDVSKTVKKWEKNGYLSECESSSEKKTLAILLQNCFLHNQTMSNSIFSTDQALWLTQQSWLRCKFKNIISVQPMIGPASLIFIAKENATGCSIVSEAVAAEVTKYNFSVFQNVDFEKIKDVYADAIAEGLDYNIFDILKANQHCCIEDIMDAININVDVKLKTMFDYLIAPHGVIEKLSDNPVSEGVDLFGINALLDPDTFSVLAVCGRYHKSFLKPPIFCPYILFLEGPTVIGGTALMLMRAGRFCPEEKYKK